MAKFAGAAEPLSEEGFRQAIEDLDVGIPELLAVLSVESRSCGFLPDRRPRMLFERHWFHKLTGGRFSAQNPDVSNPQAGGYAGDAREFPRLEQAIALDRTAALKSASWGAGQIMGFNHQAAGFADVESMVLAMESSEDAQLDAVVRFLLKRDLVRFLRSHDWPSFARAYNGAAFAKNKYDARLAGAFEQYSRGVLPDVDVRRAQLYLTYLGFAPGAIDGILGKFTRSAIVKFRVASGLGNSDRVTKAVLHALQVRVAAL